MQSKPSEVMRDGNGPVFSVIIPLEYHRGRWEECLRGWQAQTLPQECFEIVVVVPPEFPANLLAPFLGASMTALHSASTHDIALAAVGATRARGEFLFFTEAHCWPESDVLEKCMRKFEREPDLAGFSCRSERITHNRLSEAEADMYDADIEYGMKVHPWLKILDQCFVTRRACYEECGGLQVELGHFAEWVLSASYYRHNLQIGYEPDARFHHYYIGELKSLKTFTRDFVAGEMHYFSTCAPGRDEHLLVPPPEWWLRGNYDRLIACRLLSVAWKGPASTASRLRAAARWIVPALVGATGARSLAVIGCIGAACRLAVARFVGSKASLRADFKRYIGALIHEARLKYIATGIPPEAPQQFPHPFDLFANESAGLHPREQFDGEPFRWSENSAVVTAWLSAGTSRIRIECCPVRSLVRGLDASFFVNEKIVSTADVLVRGDAIEIIAHAAASGPIRLAWICKAFPARGDSRSLGLPIKRIHFEGLVASTQRSLPASSDISPSMA